MFIESNHTGMQANLTLTHDKEGHEHCLVVVKGTFTTSENGQMTLSDNQVPLTYVDEHYGDPECSSVKYESDFVPEKPKAEVLVVGFAISPEERPTDSLRVSLEVESTRKAIDVSGDRRWLHGARGLTPSDAQPFHKLPLIYENAYGGIDDTGSDGQVLVEHRNLVGVGFSPKRPPDELFGSRLPNLESVSKKMVGIRDVCQPVGFGALGRHWQQRSQFSGTYDQHWMDEVCPFLPRDFDPHFFMSSPSDQWFQMFKGGEHIRCTHMSAAARVNYVLPKIHVPVHYHFADKPVEQNAQLDTVVVEPHLMRAMLVWRACVPVGKKVTRLRSVVVGKKPIDKSSPSNRYRNGKPHFDNLGSAVKWHRKKTTS